jgi:hypothetical protein
LAGSGRRSTALRPTPINAAAPINEAVIAAIQRPWRKDGARPNAVRGGGGPSGEAPKPNDEITLREGRSAAGPASLL